MKFSRFRIKERSLKNLNRSATEQGTFSTQYGPFHKTDIGSASLYAASLNLSIFDLLVMGRSGPVLIVRGPSNLDGKKLE
jgi:hypothetical protein